jgi:hypothetical protein
MMFGLKMQSTAKEMGKKLSEGLAHHSDIKLSYPTEG